MVDGSCTCILRYGGMTVEVFNFYILAGMRKGADARTLSAVVLMRKFLDMIRLILLNATSKSGRNMAKSPV